MNEIENPVTGERVVFREGVGDPEADVLSFDFFVKPGGGVFVPHLHLEQTEIIRVIKGKLRCGLPGQEREVGPGEVVVIPAGTPQRIAAFGDEDLVFLAICTPRFTPECYQTEPDAGPA